MDITMSTREVLLLLLLLIVMTSLAATASASFGCDEVSTCRSLVGYKPKNRTTLGAIQTLFNVSDVRDIAGANGLPDSTPRDHTVGANHTIRIPLECGCYKDEAGILWSRSKNPPKYKIKKGDTFYLIGLNVFSGLVDYRQIQNVNPDAIPTNLTIGEEVIIPFLCGCGRVNEKRVAHYGMTLEKGTTIQEVARQEGSTVDAVLAANSFSDSTTYNDSETVLDIPLPVCSTMVRNDSLDYPLLVPNGTYMYTANGCVKCKCDAANNWTLHCEPSNLKPTNWFSCPSMQCRNSRNMYIGNTTSSGSDQVTLCAYAGYGNQTIFTTLATEPTPPEISLVNAKESRWWIWLVVVGGLIVVTILCYLIWRKYKTEVNRKRKKKELMSEIGSSTVASTLSHIVKGTSKDGKTNQEMQRFNFESIVAATDNFSIENKLGEGGFGPVYKGRLLDGQEIAIKRLSSKSGQGVLEFKNEVKLIAKLQHTNLVKHLGFCIHNEEKILIYEYMPNKSLDFYLFDSDRRSTITWERRFNIIQGIAHGLVYLHHFSRLKVIHRDLKTSNILLDHEMNPKISDFGLARIFELKGIEENTKRIVGTYGYMSPEYAMYGIVSVKTDVFSFGVLVLEIISGKKNSSFDYPLNLIGLAWKLWNENRGLEIVDSLMLESCSSAEVMKCVQIGLLCVQDRAADRPTMLEVACMLTYETILLPVPKQPAFCADIVARESNLSAEEQQSCSINKMTISVVDAR